MGSGNEVLPFPGLLAKAPPALPHTTSSVWDGPEPQSNHVTLRLRVPPGLIHSISRADSVPRHQLPLTWGPFLPMQFTQKSSSRAAGLSQAAEPGRCLSICRQMPSHSLLANEVGISASQIQSWSCSLSVARMDSHPLIIAAFMLSLPHSGSQRTRPFCLCVSKF